MTASKAGKALVVVPRSEREERPRGRRTSKLRVHETSAGDAKDAILGAANVLAGVLGFFENLEKGMLTGDAAKKEVRAAKARGRALARARAKENENEA